jgi:16S rRNA (uracil1498-N3)-methyltransferase
MQFIYHKDAGEELLKIDGELYKYIFKVRRMRSDTSIFFRNLEDKNLYEYKVNSLDRRKASLERIAVEEKIVEHTKKLHLGWCVIDPKSVEKYIASLNELGVAKITFIYCEYSQKQYNPNFEKLEKLLINSSQQCGRSSIIKLESMNSLEEFKVAYPESFMFNFSTENIHSKKQEIETIIIGCEGGFSQDEVESFDQNKIVGIDNNLILKSETAAMSIAGILLS